MYLFGLILIFIHYMNSSYGKWMWTLSDAWEELTPAFFNQRYVRIPEFQNSLKIYNNGQLFVTNSSNFCTFQSK